MSLILTLQDDSSTLSADFEPPIQLDPHSNYGLALLGFHCYNSIPNIEKGSKFYLISSRGEEIKIEIPEGSYEISDIENYIKQQVPKEAEFSLKPNNNTLQCEISCKDYSIDFRPTHTIGKILGFSERLLEPNKVHSSDLPVNIIKVRTIHIDTNISTGAFYNGRPAHTIHEFAVRVDPGYAIDEIPQNLIYLPVNNRREIHNLSLSILDQESIPVNFRGEEVIVRLELKQLQQWVG